jgi:hypothetical protein
MATSIRRVAIALSLVLLFPSLSLGQPAPPKKITVEYVRDILGTDTIEEWRGRDKLVSLGTAAFLVYDAILADPNHHSLERARIFDVLKDVEGDRSRYVELAIQSLSHADTPLRYAALRLLAKIGSKADTAPVVALLFDEERLIVYEAAETLVAIGSRRDLVAFDAWLRNAATNKLDSLIIEGIQKRRDALKKRLDDAENRKAPPPRLVAPRP